MNSSSPYMLMMIRFKKNFIAIIPSHIGSAFIAELGNMQVCTTEVEEAAERRIEVVKAPSFSMRYLKPWKLALLGD